MTEISHHTVRVNGIRMHYLMAGEGAPVVLLLRGYGETDKTRDRVRQTQHGLRPTRTNAGPCDFEDRARRARQGRPCRDTLRQDHPEAIDRLVVMDNVPTHMSGPHFRDYHLLLDEQANQLFDMTDPMAKRIRAARGSTLRSIGHIAKLHRLHYNDADYVDPLDMLAELREDNGTLIGRLREVHELASRRTPRHRYSQLIENWIDEAERRAWFLFESGRRIGRG